LLFLYFLHKKLTSMKILTQTVFLIFTMHLLNAQVGIGTTNPSASALLELDSSNSGLLVPRMEESERLGIGSAANGLLVYQTDVVPGFYYYDGISSTWQLLTNKEETDKGFNTNVVLDATTLKVTDGKSTIDTDLSSLKELPMPTVNGTMNYWKDGAWIVIAPTLNEGATLQMKSGVPTWVGGTPPPPPPAIGDSYLGGIVFYIYEPGDAGYVVGETHGLIAATSDQSTGIQWTLPAYRTTTVVGGTSDTDGAANTDAIIAQTGAVAVNTYAAGLCRLYSTSGNNDLGQWYLPAKDELNLMYENIGQGDALGLGNIGNFENNFYWSSTEDDIGSAWFQYFGFGGQGASFKYDTFFVRAVRAF
jgi:hypothetical protein